MLNYTVIITVSGEEYFGMEQLGHMDVYSNCHVPEERVNVYGRLSYPGKLPKYV